MPETYLGWLFCTEHMESVGSDDDRDEPEFIEVPDEQDPNQESLEALGELPGPSRYQKDFDKWQGKRKRERDEAFLDLADFFGAVPREKQISICRAYGSYLAALERAAQPVAKRTYFKSGLFKKRE